MYNPEKARCGPEGAAVGQRQKNVRGAAQQAYRVQGQAFAGPGGGVLVGNGSGKEWRGGPEVARRIEAGTARARRSCHHLRRSTIMLQARLAPRHNLSAPNTSRYIADERLLLSIFDYRPVLPFLPRPHSHFIVVCRGSYPPFDLTFSQPVCTVEPTAARTRAPAPQVLSAHGNRAAAAGNRGQVSSAFSSPKPATRSPSPLLLARS